jgi:AcrR family transcriptional regulator
MSTSSRERLLEAAIKVIELHGESAVRVDEIAQAAHVAKPSLYHFYGNREGLIAAAQAERYRRSLLVGYEDLRVQLERCKNRADWYALVTIWIQTFATTDSAQRRAMRLDVLGSSVARPALREAINAANITARRQLEQFIDHARARGWTLVDSDIATSDVAIWFHGLWNGRYLVDITNDADQIAGWDAVTTQVIELLMAGPVSE